MTIRQAADELGLGTRAIYGLIHRGILPARKYGPPGSGGRFVIDAADVAKLKETAGQWGKGDHDDPQDATRAMDAIKSA